MADNRNEWLDQVTAERLMRGEPLEDLGEPARAEAARLAGALRAVTAPETGTDRGELPGEAAAVAAFRAAASGGSASSGIVQLVPGDRKPHRARRGGYGRKLSAPFRLGVVAVVAGFAFGGVAVASGADFLPSPFDGTAPSATGTSVSAGPGERPDAGPPTPGAPTVRGPGTEGLPPGGTGTPSSSPVRPVDGPGIGSTPKPGDKDGSFQRVAKACREHRAGKTRPAGRALLERLAKGPAQVSAYCEVMLGSGAHTHPGAVGGQGQANGNGKVKGKGNANGKVKGKDKDKDKGSGGGPGNGQGGLPGVGAGAQDSLPGNGNGNGNGNGKGKGKGGPHHHGRGGDRKAERGAQGTAERWGGGPGRTDATSGSGTGTDGTGSTATNTLIPADPPPTMLV
ncbi:hypothetical protein [Streptomyces qinzhouensis]|uniref:Extensin n=1 Tax=Streptomyces qinzhouensis TaxID=2599401 RepID=A0A5B8JFK0_9ACTN|nr:hypothetical protein [Streptomyces qinzhouensis]QDY78651.1 hypothetical protein FQU76_21445 [Streptomyces qinzhouensis]